MAEFDARFDPRFDPAFQPTTNGDDPLVVDVVEPLFERAKSTTSRPTVQPTLQPTQTDEPEPAKPAPATATAAPAATAVRPRGRFNPWLALLWVLAVALIVGGVWSQLVVSDVIVDASQTVGETSAAPPTVEEFYVIPMVLSAFSPWLTVIGFAALVSAVYLHAAQWQRGRAV